MAAILDFQFLISQPFKELQGRNSNMKLNTTKSIPRTYFETKQSIFGLAGYALVAILEFEVFISQAFEELKAKKWIFFLISPIYFYGTLFGDISIFE